MPSGWPSGFKERGDFRALGELSRAHDKLVRDCVRVQNRLKSLYRSRGVSVSGMSVYSLEGRANLIDVVFAANNRFLNVGGNVLGRPGDQGLPGAVYDQESGNCLDLVAVYKLGYPSDCGISTVTDPAVKATLLRHGNFDYFHNATAWDANTASRALPASLYRQQKPAFLGAVPWPPIGPDVAGLVNNVPAKRRFDAMP